MEKINLRIFEIFNALNIKQVEFANRIGVSQAYISKLFKKNSEKTPSERIIKLICSEFSVNEEWLRNGTGNMFLENDSTIISKLSDEYKLDSLDKKIIESYLNLVPQQRKAVKNYIVSVAKAIAIDEKALTLDESEENAYGQNENNSIEEEVSAYRLELEAEKKGKISSVSEDTKESSN